MQVFLLSTVLFLTTRGTDVGSAVFDKDDSLAVEFVTAASNLRSLCYAIPPQSLFDAKVTLYTSVFVIQNTYFRVFKQGSLYSLDCFPAG